MEGVEKALVCHWGIEWRTLQTRWTKKEKERKEKDMGRLDRRRQTGEEVCLHFDQISIFQRVVWVALQGREVADTVID